MVFSKYSIYLALAFLLSACNQLPKAISQSAAPLTAHAAITIPAITTKPEQTTVIYVVSHGWHTGIILNKYDLLAYIPELMDFFPINEAASDLNLKEFIEIGWGDKDFYRATQITTKMTFKAMFMADGAIAHLVNVPMDPLVFFEGSQIKSLNLSEAGYLRLLAYIDSSLQRSPENTLIGLGKGIYGDSYFFEANGVYSLLNTCNKWTAKALQSGGVNITPTFKLTAASVMRVLD